MTVKYTTFFMKKKPANEIQDLQYFGEFGGVNPSISSNAIKTPSIETATSIFFLPISPKIDNGYSS